MLQIFKVQPRGGFQGATLHTLSMHSDFLRQGLTGKKAVLSSREKCWFTSRLVGIAGHVRTLQQSTRACEQARSGGMFRMFFSSTPFGPCRDDRSHR